MSAFDLNLLSLYRIGGQEWPQLPGLLAQNPPKKAARGREHDQLIVYLTLAGNMLYSSSEYSQIVGQIAQTFYNTSGSLTFALKAATEAINNFLIERNMQTTSKGQYSLGALVLAALRGNQFYIVQSGPTHTFTMGAESRHLHDAQLAGKGLGQSQTARMYFAQTQVNPGDRVLFCAALPPNWEKAITEERGPASIEVTRRRLMAANDGNVSAVLIQFSAGNGTINLLKSVKDTPVEPAKAPLPIPVATPAPEPASPAPDAGRLPASFAPSYEQPAPPSAPAAPVPAETSAPQPEYRPRVGIASSQSAQAAALGQESPAPRPIPVRPPVTLPPPPREQESSPEPQLLITPDQKEQFQKGLRSTARLLARSIQRGRELWHKFLGGAEKFIPRLLPSDEDGEPATLFARAWPAFIAVLVPLIVVVIGVTVYKYVGEPQRAKEYYQQAEESRQQALLEQDPILQGEHWKTVLTYLEKAAGISPLTETGQQMRQEAQGSLDVLKRVTRVDFKPALNTSLSASVQITHMAASDTDLYLLDASRGIVMRGVFNGKNYDLDANFQCGPGKYDGIQVGQLIDILALPRTNPSTATLLGVDASGNLIYCIPGETPRGSFLKTPDTGWNRITAVAYDANNLYILDAPARAVWVYFGDAEIKFPGEPYFFFEAQIPVTMEQAIGIAINGDDLYLLYSDGHMTTCRHSWLSTAPTRCNDPVVFIDTRPGYQNGIRLSDSNFTQIDFTPPPNPSVVLLQPYTQSVFRFSTNTLELTLQTLLQDTLGDEDPLPKDEIISVMAFSPNKSLFVVAGGQLYFAVNVP